MAPKKVSIMEPPKEQPAAELGEFSPPPESPAEIKARLAAEREAEQKELDSAWKKIPYVDQKDLGPGYYCGYELNRLLKPWQEVWTPTSFTTQTCHFLFASVLLLITEVLL